MACPGCGGVLAMRLILKVLGKDVIVTTCPSCNSGFAQNYTVPSVHAPFAAVASWASGIRAGLDMLGDTKTTVLAVAGDGGTFDIGIQALSAAIERNENFIFVCYDNEAYMTTGIQRSSATPLGAWTATTPVANPKGENKKRIMDIMAAHRIPYAASASIGYPEDLIYKVKRAMQIRGTRFLHVLSPCPIGWRCSQDLSVKLSRMAVESKIFPLFEIVNGLRYKVQRPQHEIPVSEYLRLQGRFSHLDAKSIDKIQHITDREWRRLLAKESTATIK
ncbi:MAG: pyruvate synthase subunit beta [Chloroflexi bacterium]|nr:pyruvate synthase subunit beta [Chloroflexota bacterium]